MRSKEGSRLFGKLNFLIGELNCRVVSIQTNDPVENRRLYYDHKHFCSEIQWVETGTCDYICDKTTYHLHAGQLIIIPPQMYHREVSASKDFKKLSILIDVCSGKEKANAFGICYYETFNAKNVRIIPADGDEVKNQLVCISSLIKQAGMDNVSKERLRIACNCFFLELFVKISGDSIAKKQSDTQGAFSQELLVEDYIAHQFMPGASFATLAEQLHVSPRQLHRIITQQYGINYRDKLKEIRVEIATNFLCNTDKSISQIAELMGYSDTSSFSYFMKKATGKSPQQIRNLRKIE